MADSRIIDVDGVRVGLSGLDEVLAEMAPGLAGLGDQEAGRALLERLEGKNYIPGSAREAYARALARELRRHLGQPVEEGAGAGMEVKVLGQGCARCESLTQMVMAALGELGLAADVEHLRDLKDIARYGVMGVPGLVINGKVVSTGVVPSPAQLKRWLSEAANR